MSEGWTAENLGFDMLTRRGVLTGILAAALAPQAALAAAPKKKKIFVINPVFSPQYVSYDLPYAPGTVGDRPAWPVPLPDRRQFHRKALWRWGRTSWPRLPWRRESRPQGEMAALDPDERYDQASAGKICALRRWCRRRSPQSARGTRALSLSQWSRHALSHSRNNGAVDASDVLSPMVASAWSTNTSWTCMRGCRLARASL